MWKKSQLPTILVALSCFGFPSTGEAGWRCKLRNYLLVTGAVAVGIEYTFRPLRDHFRETGMKAKAQPIPEEVKAEVEAGMKKFKAIRGDSGKRRDYFRSILAEEKDEATKTLLRSEIETNRLGYLFAEISRHRNQAAVNKALDELYLREEKFYYRLFGSREVAILAFSNFHNE